MERLQSRSVSNVHRDRRPGFDVRRPAAAAPSRRHFRL
jgi:hypothetical protein